MTHTSKHRVWSPKHRLVRNIPETFKGLGRSQQFAFVPQRRCLLVHETIGNTKYKYTYDNYGNIKSIYKVNSDNTESILCSYTYDSYNQLTTVDDYEHSEQTTYAYNQAGNITRRNRYKMNSSWVPTATLENIRYLYGDSEWKDLLTSYDGQTITYDSIGNPLNYRDGITFTWQKGRQLASLTDSDKTVTYSYDASGMRTGKAVTTSSDAANYSYVYENGLLQKMTRGNRILEFSYDANGRPVSLAYRSSATATPTYYYYGLNSRGDVIALYTSSGTLSCLYDYDAYGNVLSVKSSTGIDITGETSVAQLNPLRYRGYVYDNETGFYYLQSRYYDPVTCRFVNADRQLNTDSINGYNMFMYCNNNPVMFADPTGCCSIHTYYYMPSCPECNPDVAAIHKVRGAGWAQRSLLPTGKPNSSQELKNPDGTIKQKRWYDENGNAEWDRDFNHSGKNIPFPHDHEWKDGERQDDHLPPSPNYEFSLEPILGIGLVVVCTVGVIVLVADDSSGLGVIDDPAIVPVVARLGKGLEMVFD